MSGWIDSGLPPSERQRHNDGPLGFPLLERLGSPVNRVEHLIAVSLHAAALTETPERVSQRRRIVGEVDEHRRLRVEQRDAEKTARLHSVHELGDG